MKKKKKEMSKPSGYRLVASNRKASYRYHLEDRFEAGLVLLGTEVKSLRGGKSSIAEAFGRVRGGEVWLINADIPTYAMGGYVNHEPKRPRKLLLHRREVRRIAKALETRGYTLAPLSLYFNDRGIVKMQVALARGKRKVDRREDVKARDHRRDMDREMARRRKKR
ncbi:MAG: SsrA-binding protein SmpB [Planctomycetota bacterium]|jgi:SsrA-binding protein